MKRLSLIGLIILSACLPIFSRAALSPSEKIELLEERFLEGKVSERTYLELRTKYRGWIYVTYFLSIGVVSLFAPTISSYMPIGFFFLPLLLNNPGSSTTGETKTGKHGS